MIELRIASELQTINQRNYLLDYKVEYLTGAQSKRVARDNQNISHVQYRLIIDDHTVSPLSPIHTLLPIHAIEDTY